MKYVTHTHLLTVVLVAALTLLLALIVLTGDSQAGRLNLEFDESNPFAVNGGYDPKEYRFGFTVYNRDLNEWANFSVYFDPEPQTNGGNIESWIEVDGRKQDNDDPEIITLPPNSNTGDEGPSLEVVVSIGRYTDATDYSSAMDEHENGYEFPITLKDEDENRLSEFDGPILKVERRSGMEISKMESDVFEGDDGIEPGFDLYFQVEVENLGNFLDPFTLDIEDTTNGDLDNYWEVERTSDEYDKDDKLELHSYIKPEKWKIGRFTVHLRVGDNLGDAYDYENRFTVSEGEHTLTITVDSGSSTATPLPEDVITDTVEITIVVKWPEDQPPPSTDGDNGGVPSWAVPLMLGIVGAGASVAVMAFLYFKKQEEEEEDMGWGGEEEEEWGDSFDGAVRRPTPMGMAGRPGPVRPGVPGTAPARRMPAAGAPARIKCPRCAVTITVKNPKRPLKINCPKCQTGITLKAPAGAAPAQRMPAAGAPARIKCPRCAVTITVKNPKRPLKINCPKCQAGLTLK